MDDNLYQTMKNIAIGVGVMAGTLGFVIGFIAGVYLV